MSPLRRTLTALTALLTALTTAVLLASAASAQVLPPDLPHARSTPTPAPASGGFPLWAVLLSTVAAVALVLAGVVLTVRLRRHSQPQPANV